MALASWKDMCIDSSAGQTLGRFWAETLGLRFEDDDEAGALVGDAPGQRIWMNVVPEPKTVKHRVHLDVHAGSIDELVARGATVLEPAEEYGRGWTVLADPEGGEFCAFVREPAALPAYRLYEIGVDSADPQAQARWWAGVLGADVGHDPKHDWWWLENVPNLPFESVVFNAVPEPKTVKNRLHWDVDVESLEPLLAAGATLVRAKDEEIRWHVLADPEGNEFCAFPRAG